MRDERELLEMGQRIRELRADHGYKQQWIADKIGVQLRTYQFWQAGKSPPEQENLEKLAKLFNVSPKYILKGDTPEPSPNGQLDRIEQKLDQLLAQLRTPASVPQPQLSPKPPNELVQPPKAAPTTPRSKRPASRRRAAGSQQRKR